MAEKTIMKGFDCAAVRSEKTGFDCEFANPPTGFDCEFVNPPRELQSECPMCLQILREPYQASCCGNNFCRACIENETIKRCPLCNNDEFTTFHNKGLQRSLYGFQVYCSHNQEGCEWKGELGQLDKHLNLSPQPDKQLEGCEYSEIECIYCSELIKRSNIAVHQNDLCPKRPFSCEYCHSYESHYEDVINNHWPVCGYHPVQCPNECGTFPQRQALENHVTRDCPNTVIDCDFHHFGCDVRLPRKDMPAHLKENLVNHLSLQAASYNKLLAKVNKLESENETLKEQLETDRKVIQSHCKLVLADEVSQEGSQYSAVAHEFQKKFHQDIGIPIPGYVEFSMVNLRQQKKESDQWFSPPFYSHPGGYKLTLRVDTNGDGNGKSTHVSVYICLMKGEFDEALKWPFRANITVQLVDQMNDSAHYTKKISFNDRTPKTLTERVTQGDKNEGWGFPQFIQYCRLNPNYAKNNGLRFRIINILFG